MNGPTLPELTAFATIVRHRSFRRASDELGVTASALSHMMRTLEERIGARLLNRTTRSVAPTEAGEWLVARLGPLLRDFDRTFEDLKALKGRPGGNLRISVGPIAARALFRSTVPEFVKAYPDIRLDLTVDGRMVDIVAENFDAGVRLGGSVPQDMIAVRFGGETRFAPVAAPDYLARHTLPDHPEDLMGHDCIRFRLPGGKLYRWDFEQDGQELRLDVPGTLTLNQTDLMTQAALAGLGVAFVPLSEVRPLIEEGRLVAFLEEWCPKISGFCLYYPGHRHVPAPLRAFIDVLRRSTDR